MKSPVRINFLSFSETFNVRFFGESTHLVDLLFRFIRVNAQFFPYCFADLHRNVHRFSDVSPQTSKLVSDGSPSRTIEHILNILEHEPVNQKVPLKVCFPQ